MYVILIQSPPQLSTEQRKIAKVFMQNTQYPETKILIFDRVIKSFKSFQFSRHLPALPTLLLSFLSLPHPWYFFPQFFSCILLSLTFPSTLMDRSLTASMYAALWNQRIPQPGYILKSVFFIPNVGHCSINGRRTCLKMSVPFQINNFYSLKFHENYHHYFISFTIKYRCHHPPNILHSLRRNLLNSFRLGTWHDFNTFN